MPLTPDVLAYGLLTATDPQVSPDGTRILYVLRAVDPETHRPRGTLWQCDIDGSNAAPVAGLSTGALGARWSPDGSFIAYVARSERGSSLCVAMIADLGSSSREIASHIGNIGDVAWSPDATRLLYVTEFDPENPDEAPAPPGAAPKVRVTRRMDYKMDGRGWLGDRREHVFVVDIATGTRRRITTELVDHHSPKWSPDGSAIATTAGKVDGGRPGRLGPHLRERLLPL